MALALAALAPLVLLSGGYALTLLSSQRQAMEREAVHRADETINSVDRELSAQVKLLEILSKSPLLDTPSSDLAGFHDLSRRVIEELPLWRAIILTDREGRMIVNTGYDFGRALGPVVDRAANELVFTERRPVISGVAGDGPLEGPFGPRASVRVPVLRNGEIRFGLTAVIATNAIADLLTPDDLDPDWRPFLVDAAGRVVAAPRAPDRVGSFAGPPALRARTERVEGLYPGQSAFGDAVVTAFALSPTSGWSAHISIPTAIYNAPLIKSYWVIGLTGALAASAAVALILLLRRELAAEQARSEMMDRAARMEAIGRMSGGIAHDFNNILAVILAGIGRLERQGMGLGQERYLNEMQKAAETGAKLIRDLLTLARGGSQEIEIIAPTERLRALSDMIRQTVGGAVDVSLRLDDGAGLVAVDPTQFDVAILNLAANARDAMPRGGRLTITARRATDTPDGAAAILVSVTDTGMGIPDAARAKIFEPFFTTKPQGKGTGLGLTQVYGFVRGSSGSVEVESRENIGTSFTLRLPVAASGGNPRVASEFEADQQPAPTGLRILVVDDVEEIRQAVCEHLGDAGMLVSSAGSAEEALQAFEASPTPEVLVSDLRMPGDRDGLELAMIVRSRWPDTAIVLMSGYSNDAERATGAGFRLLAKPFPFRQLDAAIAAQLSKRALDPSAVDIG